MLKCQLSMSYVIPKPRYGPPKVPGQIPIYAILTYFDIFSGIHAEQTAFNYPSI